MFPFHQGRISSFHQNEGKNSSIGKFADVFCSSGMKCERTCVLHYGIMLEQKMVIRGNVVFAGKCRANIDFGSNFFPSLFFVS